MPGLEAAYFFATLVGLICNWKSERGGQATEGFQDFMKWLENHNFHALRERIFESEELQRQLTDLLRQDLAQITVKLDAVTAAVSAIADKIDSLREVGRALRAPTESVSRQALEILKAFESRKERRMIVFDFPPGLGMIPSNQILSVDDVQFLETDVQALAECGLISLVDSNDSGNPIYGLTRAGSKVAAALSDDYLPKDGSEEQ